MNKIRVEFAKTLLKMFPVAPPEKSMTEDASALLDRARSEYNDERASGFLGHFPGFTNQISGKVILDLGSGYGGRPIHYSKLGAGSVIGLEISDRTNHVAASFAGAMGMTNVHFVTGVGEQLPFEDGSFDIITSYDVLEHVQSPDRVLHECYRVLGTSGKMLAVFPPYYSIYGSHLYGYISLLPFANLLFSEHILKTAVDELLHENGNGFRPMPMLPGHRFYTLNGLTVKGFLRAADSAGFTVRRFSLAPVSMPLFTSDMFSSLRLFLTKAGGVPVSLLSHLMCRLPGAREVFANKVICELNRTS